MPKFTKKEHFLPPDTQTYVCVTGGKKCSFIKKFDVLCFLKTSVLRFVLLPYYQRFVLKEYFYKHIQQLYMNQTQ